jgi:hypothetical protein
MGIPNDVNMSPGTRRIPCTKFLCLFTLMMTFALSPMDYAQSSGSAPNGTSARDNVQVGVPGDRWMEIDLYWFEPTDIPGSVHRFWDRFRPLYDGIAGDRGVVLNVGWTVSYIMEWSGDLNQRITLPSGTGQQPWVQEKAPLSGTTHDRQRRWKERFASQVMISRQGYGAWTYGQLRTLNNALREGAKRQGIENFKVGSLAYAWNDAYGEIAPWAKKHDEAFTHWTLDASLNFNHGTYFNPGAKLHQDSTTLGSMPNGISEGARAHSVFASQWGSLSRSVGLDAIMLRDSFGMPVPYERAGPWGAVAPSPELIAQATENVSALIRETKTSNPNALVMMYSNAASAMSDWRSNGLDLERIAREGFLDVYVDQTWAGAWNEVGVRHNAFWNVPTLGWTYQLTSTLMHAAVLAGSHVRHYPLIETFDAWESWDVLHSVPNRLRWGIWAYSHASVKTPNGIEVPVGSYISWANQGKNLLTESDVSFLKTNIDAAVRDARETSEVYGPVLVYARSATQWQAEHARPNADVKEWLDEQTGSVIKWPVPVLSSTRIEWLPDITADMYILGAPSHLSKEELHAVARVVNQGHPTAIFGSPAGGEDMQIQNLAGLSAVTQVRSSLAILSGTALASGLKLVSNLPEQFPVRQSPSKNMKGKGGETLYLVGTSPVLVLNAQGGKRILSWDPPDFMDAWDKPLKETWGGSAAPYALAAGAMNVLLDSPQVLHATRIDLDQTLNVSAWQTRDGTLHIMAANLEEGLRDDADMSRIATLQLPSQWKDIVWHSLWTENSERLNAPASTFSVSNGILTIRLAQAASLQLEGHTAQ